VTATATCSQKVEEENLLIIWILSALAGENEQFINLRAGVRQAAACCAGDHTKGTAQDNF
jgi:hypothetical protein